MQLTYNKPEIKAEIDLGHSKLVFRSDNVLEMICDDDAVYDVKNIRQIILETGKLTGGKKCMQLTIAGKYSTVSKEGREYAATEEAVEFTIAEAYVIQSLAQRILGNFYLKFNKPKVPTRLFTDKDKAEKWLKSVTFS